jgi:hypothetical protein
MAIGIKITGLEEVSKKAKDTVRELVSTPVPLGKTVLVTGAVIGLAQIYIFRKAGVVLVLARKT